MGGEHCHHDDDKDDDDDDKVDGDMGDDDNEIHLDWCQDIVGCQYDHANDHVMIIMIMK